MWFHRQARIAAIFFVPTVNEAAYLEMLQSHLKQHLLRVNRITFQQDGAPPHIANNVRRFLSETFGDRITSHLF